MKKGIIVEHLYGLIKGIRHINKLKKGYGTPAVDKVGGRDFI